MRLIVVFLLLITTCAKTYILDRQYGVHERIPVDPRDIISIDTVHYEYGGAVKKVKFLSNKPDD